MLIAVLHMHFLRYLSAMWPLRAPKPISPNYPKKLETLGEHIRKRRLDLGLLQKDVASLIGVSKATIYNWEANEASPQIHHLPKIIEFLGYNASPASRSISEKLLVARRLLGLTQKAMAKRLGIDPTTLERWEAGKSNPSAKSFAIVRLFLKKLAAGNLMPACAGEECRHQNCRAVH